MGRERGYEDIRMSLTFPSQVGKPSIKINFCVIRKMEHSFFLFPLRLKDNNNKNKIKIKKTLGLLVFKKHTHFHHVKKFSIKIMDQVWLSSISSLLTHNYPSRRCPWNTGEGFISYLE